MCAQQMRYASEQGCDQHKHCTDERCHADHVSERARKVSLAQKSPPLGLIPSSGVSLLELKDKAKQKERRTHLVTFVENLL